MRILRILRIQPGSLTVLAWLGLLWSNAAWAGVIEDRVLEPSVTVTASNASGSGVIFIHEAATYVLTAGHVVEGLRSVQTYLDAGAEKKREVWRDASVVQIITEAGRQVGKLELNAEVVAYDEKEDLAILRVRRSGYFTRSAVFGTPQTPAGPGDPVLHCGSRSGEMGANSLSGGIVSAVGRLIEERVFDQTDAPASPGSSGGGVFARETGEYLGMVTRGAGETFVLLIPMRRISTWLLGEGYGYLCPAWGPQPVVAEGPAPVALPEPSPPAGG